MQYFWYYVACSGRAKIYPGLIIDIEKSSDHRGIPFFRNEEAIEFEFLSHLQKVIFIVPLALMLKSDILKRNQLVARIHWNYVLIVCIVLVPT